MNPKFLGTGILRIFLAIRGVFKSQVPIDLERIDRSIAFNRTDIEAGSFEKTIELVFVSIKKDFPVLIESIKYGQRSISEYQYGGTRVIVPDHEVSEGRALLVESGLSHVSVLPESMFISRTSMAKLNQTFSSRATWVLQQLLKVQAVMTSEADASLIIDSDTLLLTRRPWFSATGTQLLTPTFEYHDPYYRFLSRLGISNSFPEYTFISHHMLMQKSELKMTLQNINWGSETEIVDYICSNADSSQNSSICVEYELYAQALLNRSPHKIHFGLWSNASISRDLKSKLMKDPIKLLFAKRAFHSISFHSWSQVNN